MAEDLGNLAGISEPLRLKLYSLRKLVLDAAASNAAVGLLAESLKWGEPSYTPAKKGVGSSVRIAPRKDGKLSMNFICHTGLVGRFREIYGEKLEFEGNRTIIIDPAKPLPTEELRHCIGMALTYHLAK
jgi:hypothetical protein